EDGRLVVGTTGTLTLRAADTFDAGLYHCIGTNHNDADTLTFRITVVDPYVEHDSVNGAQLSATAGSTLYLPCTSTAVPDAAVSWVSPEHAVLHRSVRNKHVFDNGTLRIQGVTERDSGYFQCVAANRYGVDLLVFQVLVRKDATTLKGKHVAVGEGEEGDGSGDAMLASATTQKHPSATPATVTARGASAASAPGIRGAQRARGRNSRGRPMYRHYRDRRLRGHRRPFVSSARRVDPQRWAAFLEKTKRNATWASKRGEVATKPPAPVRKFSEAPGDEEGTSGDLSPEEEFMIPVTGRAAVPALGRALESLRAAGPATTASNTPARKSSLLDAGAVTPPPPPLAEPASPDSKRPHTDLKPAVTNSWERPDLRQISADFIKQSNGASRATLFPARQRLVHSGSLKPVSTTLVPNVTGTSKSVASPDAQDKLQAFTQSTGKISTGTDRQVPVATASELGPESGHTYYHRTQARVAPTLPSDAAAVAHQHVQLAPGGTALTPQPQQHYGRRRKISGRRRIGRPGRVPGVKEPRYHFGRGGTALAAGAQLSSKHVSSLPTLNNLSSSVSPFSPEAPLSSPRTADTPSEHPARARQDTAFPREEENGAGARQNATTTVMPLITEGTQRTPPWKLETRAPFRTSTNRGQSFRISLPAPIHTAHAAAQIAHPVTTETPPTPESGSPGTQPRTSPKSSPGEEATGEGPFGSGAQRDARKKVPEQQAGTFPSTAASTALPKTTAALPTSKTSPLHSGSAGGSPSLGFLSLNKPLHNGNAQWEQHLPTAKPHPEPNPATSAATERDVAGAKPTLVPVISPQTDPKITKSKIFRVGRKRGQRRKRPPKTSASQGRAAGRSTAAVPSGSTARSVVTAVKSLPVLTRLTSTNPPLESAHAAAVTGVPAPRTDSTHAATVTGVPAPRTDSAHAATVTGMPTPRTDSAHAATVTDVPTPQTDNVVTDVSTTSTRPAPLCATSGSAPAHQIKVTAVASGEGVIQGNQAAQPTLPAGTEPSAPAATRGVTPPSAQHPAPPP
ncbi:IGS10 protein, partial [Rhynochetos jubatus]|nr:IGS10 protein [Rhynochetos jubatus]